MTTTLCKTDLRQHYRAWRRQLPVELRQRHAEQALAHLTRTLLFRRSQRIGCYLAVQGELDCQPLIQLCQRLGKEMYLPVLHPHANRLSFARYRLGDPLVRPGLGIQEPKGRQLCPAWALDMVLMPLVAYDLRLNRLGMGGGYYDRTFAVKTRSGLGPVLLGWAHHGQCHASGLPSEPWDVPMAAVITELGWQSKKNSR